METKLYFFTDDAAGQHLGRGADDASATLRQTVESASGGPPDQGKRWGGKRRHGQVSEVHTVIVCQTEQHRPGPLRITRDAGSCHDDDEEGEEACDRL